MQFLISHYNRQCCNGVVKLKASIVKMSIIKSNSTLELTKLNKKLPIYERSDLFEILKRHHALFWSCEFESDYLAGTKMDKPLNNKLDGTSNCRSAKHNIV